MAEIMSGRIRLLLSAVMIACAAVRPPAQSTMRMCRHSSAECDRPAVRSLVAGGAGRTSAASGTAWTPCTCAYPFIGVNLGTPRFLSAATLGVKRPDVARIFGSAFETSGFQLVVRAACRRPVLLVAFARQISTELFSATTVSITAVQRGLSDWSARQDNRRNGMETVGLYSTTGSPWPAGPGEPGAPAACQLAREPGPAGPPARWSDGTARCQGQPARPGPPVRRDRPA